MHVEPDRAWLGSFCVAAVIMRNINIIYIKYIIVKT